MSTPAISVNSQVFYWDGNGRTVYGTVRSIRRLDDGSIVVDIRTTSNTTITLPMSNRYLLSYHPVPGHFLDPKTWKHTHYLMPRRQIFTGDQNHAKTALSFHPSAKLRG
ncbi:hypothetical protein B0H16DRAFT_1451760 [Mycena metata]|uniref:Uncharacterized protein n=1 Tax=Mycena metata TaxID=1033252 RepID=A0AAD7JXV4_9AGAR|nr:hypothetical protein B0H16DRAFT_1451760 [Mycena metata]